MRKGLMGSLVAALGLGTAVAWRKTHPKVPDRRQVFREGLKAALGDISSLELITSQEVLERPDSLYGIIVPLTPDEHSRRPLFYEAASPAASPSMPVEAEVSWQYSADDTRPTVAVSPQRTEVYITPPSTREIHERRALSALFERSPEIKKAWLEHGANRRYLLLVPDGSDSPSPDGDHVNVPSRIAVRFDADMRRVAVLGEGVYRMNGQPAHNLSDDAVEAVERLVGDYQGISFK